MKIFKHEKPKAFKGFILMINNVSTLVIGDVMVVASKGTDVRVVKNLTNVDQIRGWEFNVVIVQEDIDSYGKKDREVIKSRIRRGN